MAEKLFKNVYLNPESIATTDDQNAILEAISEETSVAWETLLEISSKASIPKNVTVRRFYEIMMGAISLL